MNTSILHGEVKFLVEKNNPSSSSFNSPFVPAANKSTAPLLSRYSINAYRLEELDTGVKFVPVPFKWNFRADFVLPPYVCPSVLYRSA